ncbi:MAG: methyltransferase domain-containing protein [Acidiferrobacteraceae bacterium]
MVFLEHFLTSRSRLLEIGPEDCSRSYEVARQVHAAYAVDISKTMSHRTDAPANLQLVISDCRTVPIPPESIDAVVSDDRKGAI